MLLRKLLSIKGTADKPRFQFARKKCAVYQLHPLLYVKLSRTLVEEVSPIFPLRICSGTLLFCWLLSVARSRLWYVGNISQQHCTLICGKVKDKRKHYSATLFIFLISQVTCCVCVFVYLLTYREMCCESITMNLTS